MKNIYSKYWAYARERKYGFLEYDKNLCNYICKIVPKEENILDFIETFLEGNNFPRTVIWEFPSYEKAVECHNSKEYQNGWAIAKETTERNFQIIEGT